MMTTTTPQQLGRTSEPHHHDDLDMFCLRCITGDLFRPDFRGELALLTCMHLRHLAEHRATARGLTWEDTWLDVLDLDALAADFSSSDTLRRTIVRRAQATVQDFLFARRAMARKQLPRSVVVQLQQIEQRTRVQLDELGVDRHARQPGNANN